MLLQGPMGAVATVLLCKLIALYNALYNGSHCNGETENIFEKFSSSQPRPWVLQEGRDSMEAMEEALNFVLKWGGLLAVILIPIWPLLALPAGVFSEGKASGLVKSIQQCVAL